MHIDNIEVGIVDGSGWSVQSHFVSGGSIALGIEGRFGNIK